MADFVFERNFGDVEAYVITVDDDAFLEEKVVKIFCRPIMNRNEDTITVYYRGSNHTFRLDTPYVWPTKSGAVLGAARVVKELREQGYKAKFKSGGG
jgi:hypothetical protein